MSEPCNDELLRRFVNGVRAVKSADGDGNEREVELSFSSEEPYERWFGIEVLSHQEGAVDLTRLNEIGVLLFNHDRNQVIGQIVSATVDAKAGRSTATVRFDTDEESEKIYQKVKSGTLKGVSVGYIVNEFTVEESDNKGEPDTYTATKWMPYEISIVSIPADPTVGVGRSIGDKYYGIKPKTKEEEKNMGDNNPTITEPTNEPITPEAQARAAVELERKRIDDIMTACRTFGMDADDFIRSGISAEEANKKILQKLAEDRKASNISVQMDESDKFRAAAIDGLAMRCGLAVEKPAAGADDFRGKRMLSLAAECLERGGMSNARDLDENSLVREALTGTGQFAGILSNVANKSMAQSYQTAPTTFQIWTGRGSNSDFKNATRYRLSEAEELVKMTENGEFTNAEITEASVTTSVATYGRSFSITRQALINDDLGALSTIPAKYGAAAKRMINKMVYEVLTSNPTIEGAALFDAKHGNVGTAGITVEGIAALKSQMARQTNIGGKEALNIQPAYIIVPPELEITAAQLISSAVDPTKANATPNPFANRLSVVCDPALVDTKAWYLAAAAGYCPTIEVTYLNGNETPFMESAVQFDTLGIKWRIYQDVGVNLLDFRGLQKSTGTGK